MLEESIVCVITYRTSTRKLLFRFILRTDIAQFSDSELISVADVVDDLSSIYKPVCSDSGHMEL